MARGDDVQKENSIGQRVQNSSRFKSSKAEKSPTFQQLLQRDGSKWSRISLQKQKKNHDKEVDLIHLNKKSVLAIVKEKAKKLKQSFSGKNQREDNESEHPSITRPSNFVAHEKGGEDARTYESKHTSAPNKQAPLLIPEKHPEKRNAEQGEDEHTSSSNRTTEAESKNQVPSDAVVVAADTNTKRQTASTTDSPEVHELSESNSRSSLAVCVPENIKTKDDMKGGSEKLDNGVSVKEDLFHKFESGVDERSKVITETISPRLHKMREATSSFLKNEEQPATNSPDIDNNVNLNFKSKSLPASTDLNNNTESKIASIKPSYSLPSSASKASSTLNQTFRSTFASYQSHFLGSSSNCSPKLNSSATPSGPNTKPGSSESSTSLPSPTKTSSLLLGHTSSANESQSPVSAADQTRAPTAPANSVRRVPVSNRTRFPKHIESNTNRVPVQTDTNETKSSVSNGDQSRSPS